MLIRQRITIIRIQKPSLADVNTELQWLGSSLGLFNLRDKDKSCFRIFVELVKAGKKEELVTSDELAYRAQLTRGTVVHHLNRLMESGLVVHRKQGYGLRENNLKALVAMVEKDIQRTCEELKRIANEVDQKIGN